MKKQNKILLAVLAVVIVAGVVFYAGGSELFQGKLSKVSKRPRCNTEFGNFEPNAGTVVGYGTPVEFRWNGPGCSNYNWNQYSLCFENVKNSQEFACIGVIPTGPTHWTLSEDDWVFIDGEMKTLAARNLVTTKWYIQSEFGNALEGEILKTKSWKFSYTK